MHGSVQVVIRGKLLAQMEKQTQSIVPATVEERSEWRTQQSRMARRLLRNAQVPLFVQNITRLANLNQLEQFDLTSAEYVVDESGALSAHDALMQAVGIRRYEMFTLTFSGDYRNIAGFINAVGRLPRLMEFVSINLSGTRRMSVIMTFRVYEN